MLQYAFDTLILTINILKLSVLIYTFYIQIHKAIR